MRINFFFLAFLIPLSSLGQRVIKNEATNRHLHTDGTNIYLIPPTGFIPSTKHKGFGHTESNATIIIHVLELPLEVVHRQTSKKELAGQGWDWISEEKISVNGLNGYLIKASQQNLKGNNLKWTLIFEYEVYTNVVQCIFSDGTHSLNQDLERALASVVFKPFVELAIMPFELHVEKYGFSFWNVINGINLYRATGRGGIELTFTSDHFLIKNRTTELELIFYNKMKQMPFSSVTLTEMGMEAIELDGLSGLQAKLKTRNDRHEEGYAYQVLLSQGQNYFLLQGTSPTIEGLDTIKELVKTFKKGKL